MTIASECLSMIPNQTFLEMVSKGSNCQKKSQRSRVYIEREREGNRIVIFLIFSLHLVLSGKIFRMSTAEYIYTVDENSDSYLIHMVWRMHVMRWKNIVSNRLIYFQMRYKMFFQIFQLSCLFQRFVLESF